MYKIVGLLLVVLCLLGIYYMNKQKKNYQNSTYKKEILKYFEEMGATSVETGIKTKDLPKEIAKSPELLMMVQDGTLKFEKWKYFLN